MDVYLWLHRGVLPPFALPQTFSLSPLKELTPKALLRVKPENRKVEDVGERLVLKQKLNLNATMFELITSFGNWA